MVKVDRNGWSKLSGIGGQGGAEYAVNEIVHGKRSINAYAALRLSWYFGLSERFWMSLQGRYDLEVGKKSLEGRLERDVKVCK